MLFSASYLDPFSLLFKVPVTKGLCRFPESLALPKLSQAHKDGSGSVKFVSIATAGRNHPPLLSFNQFSLDYSQETPWVTAPSSFVNKVY